MINGGNAKLSGNPNAKHGPKFNTGGIPNYLHTSFKFFSLTPVKDCSYPWSLGISISTIFLLSLYASTDLAIKFSVIISILSLSNSINSAFDF